MSRRANIERHSLTHAAGGSDPTGPVDSTVNQPVWGTRSVKSTGNEDAGLVLTATGAGGSVWSPALPAAGRTLAEIVLAHPCTVAFWPMNDTGPGAADLFANFDLAENPTGAGGGQPVGSQNTYAFTYGQTGPYAGDPDVKSILFDGDSAGFTSYGTCLYHQFTGGDTIDAPFTLAGWALFLDTSFSTVFSLWAGSTQQTILIAGSGNITFDSTVTAGSASVTATGPASSPVWRYLVCTCDGTTIELWVDGVSAGTDTLPGTFDAGGGYLRFGLAGNSGITNPTNYMRGRLSSWALFDCVLSSGDIAELFAATGASTDEGMVPTADGAGGWEWAFPTIEVDPPGGRYDKLIPGTGLTGTDNGDGSVTIDATATGGGASPTDTACWMPLTTTTGGDDVLVFDADHSLIPTLVPF